MARRGFKGIWKVIVSLFLYAVLYRRHFHFQCRFKAVNYVFSERIPALLIYTNIMILLGPLACAEMKCSSCYWGNRNIIFLNWLYCDVHICRCGLEMLLMDVPSFGERQGNQSKFLFVLVWLKYSLLLLLSKIRADHIKFCFSSFHRDLSLLSDSYLSSGSSCDMKRTSSLISLDFGIMLHSFVF